VSHLVAFTEERFQLSGVKSLHSVQERVSFGTGCDNFGPPFEPRPHVAVWLDRVIGDLLVSFNGVHDVVVYVGEVNPSESLVNFFLEDVQVDSQQ
jgi:hypothetical protein